MAVGRKEGRKDGGKEGRKVTCNAATKLPILEGSHTPSYPSMSCGTGTGDDADEGDDDGDERW